MAPPPFEGTQTDTDVILIRKSYIRAALPIDLMFIVYIYNQDV